MIAPFKSFKTFKPFWDSASTVPIVLFFPN
jgi:hypothetical protein